MINFDESYTGKEIREWCKDQIENKKADSVEAEELYEKYWGSCALVEFTPNDNVYYYAVYERNYKGFKEARLLRDKIKSPKM